MIEPARAQLGSAAADRAPVPGVRVVLDARPMQEPQRAPLTAAYLDGLLGAFDATPLGGESFAMLLQSDLADPTERLAHLPVAGRRYLPPTRLLRSGALTVDTFVLSGASLGAAWRADKSGAAGAVYHTTSGAIPLRIGLPVVVTLLDLAPWELADTFQRGASARFGQRLRGRLVREAAAVIVGSNAVAAEARRLLHVRKDRLRVIPLAPRPAFRFWAGDATPVYSGAPSGASNGAHLNGGHLNGGSKPLNGAARTDNRTERERLGLPERYLVYPGRFDARQDLATLLRALADLASAGRPRFLPEDVPWPPRVLLVGASPEDRASLARAAAREGVGEALAYAPRLEDTRLAALVRGARAAVLPVLSDSAGLAAIEALACGTPVVASAVGALPEIVGAAGILVEPRDPGRLAAALETAWNDDAVIGGLAVLARERAEAERRTWADVARETRAVYAEVGVRA